MGDTLRQFLAFLEPLAEPASHQEVTGDDQVVTSGHPTRGVFAIGAVITQDERGVATDAQASLPRAA
jgi:hypothetical protein